MRRSRAPSAQGSEKRKKVTLGSTDEDGGATGANDVNKQFKSPVNTEMSVAGPSNVSATSPPQKSLGIRRTKGLTALHDPVGPDSLILYRPNESWRVDNGVERMIVVDPILSSKLRNHQRLGVRFMWECLHGRINMDIPSSVILGDSGSTGKRMQLITILWTLFRQSPTGPGDTRNALIVSSSSHVQSWREEFGRWLGNTKKLVLLSVNDDEEVDEDGVESFSKINQFISGSSLTSGNQGHARGPPRVLTVLVLSYSSFLSYCDSLQKTELDMIVLEEDTWIWAMPKKLISALVSMRARRRVGLVSSEINEENVLSCLPYLQFVFNNGSPWPQKHLLKHQQNRGDVLTAMSKSIYSTIKSNILRRLLKDLDKYRKPCVEIILCVMLSESQRQTYEELINSVEHHNTTDSKPTTQALDSIRQDLGLICSCPELLERFVFTGLMPLSLVVSDGKINIDFQNCGNKIIIIDQLIQAIRSNHPTDKLVIITSIGRILDYIAALLDLRGFSYFKIDPGTLSRAEVIETMNTFNEASQTETHILLFSNLKFSHSMATAVTMDDGDSMITLPGANRLIFFDSATSFDIDLGLGGRKRCFVYRLLSTGTFEEKVFLDGPPNSVDSICFTPCADSVIHESLNCERCVGGVQLLPPSSESNTKSGLEDWNHTTSGDELPEDAALKSTFKTGHITFAFFHSSHEPIQTP